MFKYDLGQNVIFQIALNSPHRRIGFITGRKREGLGSITYTIKHGGEFFYDIQQYLIREYTEKVDIPKTHITLKGFQMPIQDEPYNINEELMKHLRNIIPPKIMTITTNPSEPNLFKYYHLSLDDCALDAMRYSFGNHKGTLKIGNRIPDRVIFNKEKGKTTLLFSVENNGVAPYEAYTSKVNDDVDYCKHTGFYVTYFKYLNRNLSPKELKARINKFYQFKEESNVLVALHSVAENEMLKIITREKLADIYTAIFEVGNNGSWDYAEWKEMLRVHELETAKEAKKKIHKEIKNHQKEIEKLKGEIK